MKLPRVIADLPGQKFLFDLGEPQRRVPTRDEIEAALAWGSKLAVGKRHRGRPPQGMNFEDLRQEVAVRAYKRLRHFAHGGKKTLEQFTYLSCCFALIDIQNESNAIPEEKKQQSYPLFDRKRI